MVQFRTEYAHYKAESQRLQIALAQAEEGLGSQLRSLSEKDKDNNMRIQELESLNNDLSQRHREAVLEVQRLDRDLR